MHVVTNHSVKWSDDMRVDGHKIDESRRHLLAIVSRLSLVIDTGASHSDMSDILCELADYAGYGFLDEERAMSRSYYPERDDHVTQHWDFINRLTVFIADFERGTLRANTVFEFLLRWINVHLKEQDLLFGHYIGPVPSEKTVNKYAVSAIAA